MVFMTSMSKTVCVCVWEHSVGTKFMHIPCSPSLPLPHSYSRVGCMRSFVFLIYPKTHIPIVCDIHWAWQIFVRVLDCSNFHFVEISYNDGSFSFRSSASAMSCDCCCWLLDIFTFANGISVHWDFRYTQICHPFKLIGGISCCFRFIRPYLRYVI